MTDFTVDKCVDELWSHCSNNYKLFLNIIEAQTMNKRKHTCCTYYLSCFENDDNLVPKPNCQCQVRFDNIYPFDLELKTSIGFFEDNMNSVKNQLKILFYQSI